MSPKIFLARGKMDQEKKQRPFLNPKREKSSKGTPFDSVYSISPSFWNAVSLE